MAVMSSTNKYCITCKFQ